MNPEKMFVFIRLFFIGLIITYLCNCSKDDLIVKKNPVVTWENPSDIISGTALSAIQLNAAANVAGTFIYTPPIGSVLSVGANQNLKVDFTPTDAVNYNSASKTVKIKVFSLAIGDDYQGGKVAYFLVNGDPGYVTGQVHGLIAAVADQGIDNMWYNGTCKTSGAAGTAIGTGSANTTEIINSLGNT